MNMPWTPSSQRRATATSHQTGSALWVTAGVLIAALLLGGASRENLLQISLLELLSLPLLGAAITRLNEQGGWPAVRTPAAILAAAAAIPLLQLVPLPFELWEVVPGRQASAQALRLLGMDDGWRPLSLAPMETWRHALALLPPAAIFLAVCTLRDKDRRWLTIVFPAAAAFSLLLGIIQVNTGDGSPFYFYDTTNAGSAVGLFANRNHQAALLVASLPFAALWIDTNRLSRRTALVPVAAALTVFLIEIVGLVVVRSRAGVLLLIPGLIASLLLVWRASGVGGGRRGPVILSVLAAVALTGALIFGAGPLLERFQDSGDGRLDTAPVAAQAAWAHLPFGAGVGSFPQVYAAVEPVETMSQLFWNHAHNDYLEIWLDAGWPGAAVLLAFLVWWGSRVFAAWRGGNGLGERLARVGSVATGLLLIHSAVDYPLRTLALACLFAVGCALMVTAPPPAKRAPVSAAR